MDVKKHTLERFLRRLLSASVAAVLAATVFLPFTNVIASYKVIGGYSPKSEQTLYNGVQQSYYELPSDSSYGLQKLWVTEFDLAQRDLYVDVEMIGNYSNRLGTVANTVNSYKALHPDRTPIVAINGDLWMASYAHARVLGSGTTYGGCSDAVVTRALTVPRGFNMYEGEIITTSHMVQETPFEGEFYSFGITDDYVPVMGDPKLEITVVDETKGKTVKADGLNRLPAKDALVLYSDKGCEDNYALDESFEVIIDADSDYRITHGAKISGTVTDIVPSGSAKTGSQKMKANRLILTSRGSTVDAISNFEIGDRIKISFELTDALGRTDLWRKVTTAVGGHMAFVVNGVRTGFNDATRYPSAIIGYDNSGKMVFIVNDGRQSGYSTGIRISQLDELAKDLDLNTAFLLDGGGSATLVNGTTLINSPSDGSPRSVVNSIILASGPERGAQGDFSIEIPEPVDQTFYTFTKETDLRYLTNPNTCAMAVADSALVLLSNVDNSNDVFVTLNYGEVSADRYKYIGFRVKTWTTKTTGVIGLFLCAGSINGATPNSYKSFNLKCDGLWHNYVVDLSTYDKWNGTIHNIRIDIFDHTTVKYGEGVSIECVRLFDNAQDAQAFVAAGEPTPRPTATPTPKPTATPTPKPTATPTPKPTATPTPKPTATPTLKPTATPTPKPTYTPTAKPTNTPTAVPTATPTAVPTEIPTEAPTFAPTDTPTPIETALPTSTPEQTVQPTESPSSEPDQTPTATPNATPSTDPTDEPIEPSATQPGIDENRSETGRNKTAAIIASIIAAAAAVVIIVCIAAKRKNDK